MSLAAGALGPWAYVLSHVVGATLVALLAIVHGVRVGLLDHETLKSVGICVLAAAACCVLDYLGLGIDVGALPIRGSWILGPVVIFFVMQPYLRLLWHLNVR